MGRLFWILLALLGAVLILLISSGDSGTGDNTILGMQTGQFAAFATMSLWALYFGSSLFGRGVRLGDTARQLSIWAFIITVLMGGYVFRFELQDIGSRMTGGIIPGSPISAQATDGRLEVTLIRSPNGHFEADAGVNNASIRFLIDTGATDIVLSAQDAKEIGIDVARLRYDLAVNTANGRTFVAPARIEQLSLGGIERRNLRVSVAQDGAMKQSLLGQQFLESLSSYERRGDRLILRD